MPPSDLPYQVVSYSQADAVSAFAAVGLRLKPKSKAGAITTLGSRGDALEVDVFGEPQQVKAAGFHDYVLSKGRYVHLPRTCSTGLVAAERWKGNLRVVVRCIGARRAGASLLGRVDRALARLEA